MINGQKYSSEPSYQVVPGDNYDLGGRIFFIVNHEHRSQLGFESGQLRANPFESESRQGIFFSNFHQVAVEKARQLVPEAAAFITQVISEVDRLGIKNFSLFEAEHVTFPVSVVNVTDVFKSLFADKLFLYEPSATSQTQVNSRATVIIPGISPPPYGHPFTVWDYVYNQVFSDLSRLVSAWRRGEPLPNMEVHVFASTNSDWGRVSPEWLQKVESEGFVAHGRELARYLKQFLPNFDRARVNGISMGAVVTTKAVDFLSPEEAKKIQFILDNPADHHYANKILQMIRAFQLPVGFGMDGIRTLLTSPHYRQSYAGEKTFIDQLNSLIKTKLIEESIPGQDVTMPNADPLQISLKRQVAIAEGLALVKQPPASLEKRAYVRKGVLDFTVSTFGDVMRSIRGKLIHSQGKRLCFTVRCGHQRDNLRVEKWAKVLKSAVAPRNQTD